LWHNGVAYTLHLEPFALLPQVECLDNLRRLNKKIETLLKTYINCTTKASLDTLNMADSSIVFLDPSCGSIYHVHQHNDTPISHIGFMFYAISSPMQCQPWSYSW
jgi:hypothetical protein